MMMRTIAVATGKPYNINIKPGLLVEPKKIVNTCVGLATTQIIICEQSLEELYAKPLQKSFADAGVQCYILTFSGGERKKNRKQKKIFEDQMLALGCNRDTCIIAIGGGVTTDLAGFIAATFNRGIALVYIPTSLLAMVDASIGGKTAVNTAYGKNLIGCFYQPNAVFIDPAVLQTLPKRELANGMAEVIKHSLLADKKLFLELTASKHKIFNFDLDFLSEVIAINCEIKKNIVEQDERDHGKRQWLNLGHTIAHVLEVTSNHRLSHGKAVALGLIAEMTIAIKLNICQPQLLEPLKQVLKDYKLPTTVTDSIDIEACRKALKLDKKNKAAEIHCVFIRDFGKPYQNRRCYTHTVTESQILDALNALKEI